MGLFKHSAGAPKNSCSACIHYVAAAGQAFCARDLPTQVNVRYLSPEGIKRQCVRCPEPMTCASWQAR
jgi:hypothetical protein